MVGYIQQSRKYTNVQPKHYHHVFLTLLSQPVYSFDLLGIPIRDNNMFINTDSNQGRSMSC